MVFYGLNDRIALLAFYFAWHKDFSSFQQVGILSKWRANVLDTPTFHFGTRTDEMILQNLKAADELKCYFSLLQVSVCSEGICIPLVSSSGFMQWNGIKLYRSRQFEWIYTVKRSKFVSRTKRNHEEPTFSNTVLFSIHLRFTSALELTVRNTSADFDALEITSGFSRCTNTYVLSKSFLAKFGRSSIRPSIKASFLAFDQLLICFSLLMVSYILVKVV